MPCSPNLTGPGAISRCRLSSEIGAAPVSELFRGALVDQIKPTFDAVEPPANVVQPHVHPLEVHFHPGEIVLDRTEPRNHLVQLPTVLVLRGSDRPKHVEDQVSPLVAHAFP